MNKMDKPDTAAIERAQSELAALVNLFTRGFSNLENEMAVLLHNVLFFNDHYTPTRVAHAIYFSPEGFGARQNIVNNALTEWLVEHPLGECDYLKEWNCINHRLTTLRGIRNLIAHGSVRTLWIRKQYHVRVFPPTFDPSVADRVIKGTLPGLSASEVQHNTTFLAAATSCVMHMGIAIAEHEYGETTWRRRFDELGVHRNLLNSLFPDDQTPKACKDQPQSSQG